MIKKLEDNDVFEAIKLMNKSTEQIKYPYARNEAVWIKYFLSLVEQQNEGSPHALVIGYYTNDELRGFLSAATFVNYYNNEYIMDVKDCIVDHNYNNGLVVCRLFDNMIEHVKNYGGKSWRADSIHDTEDAMRYGRFLEKRYNGQIHISVRGEV